MTKWDMVKRNIDSNGKVISTGQKITPLFDDNSGLKERVSKMENKLDMVLTLLNKEKQPRKIKIN